MRDDETVVERDTMIAMRDGIRLATDIHRPARNGVALAGSFPVILERTPYGKAETSRSELARSPLVPGVLGGKFDCCLVFPAIPFGEFSANCSACRSEASRRC